MLVSCNPYVHWVGIPAVKAMGSYQFRPSQEWHKSHLDNDFLSRFTFSCKNLDRLLCLLWVSLAASPRLSMTADRR